MNMQIKSFTGAPPAAPRGTARGEGLGGRGRAARASAVTPALGA